MSATTDPNLPSRLLGIWAHPDDEAYLSAGLMARVVDHGGHVTVLTLTRGEKGSADPTEYAQPRFAAHRETELRTSLGELGVRDLRFAGLADGECARADQAREIARIEALIAEVDPELIITFGPDGITGHADHRAVSRWTTAAWRRTGTAALRYATMSHDFVARHATLHDRIGLFAELPDGPASVPREQIDLAVALNEAELDRKRRALAHHASQTAPLAELVGEATYRTWWGTEMFRRPTEPEMSLTAPASRRFAPPVEVAA